MKIKLFKYKKTLIGATAVLLIAGISIPLFSKPSDNGQIVREREYTAKKDSITVGVESSGLINTLPNIHSFEENTVVDKMFVKVGNEVKKGDKLATISSENLKDLIQAAKDELSDERAVLLQATSTKDVLLSQNNKNKKDGLNDIDQEFATKFELLNSEKKQIQKPIKEYQVKIADLEKQINTISPQIADVENKISNFKSQLNNNSIEIGKLNEELLKIDDGTVQRKFLNQTISNTQFEIQNLNTQLSEKLLSVEKNRALIENLEAENTDKAQKIKDLEEQIKSTEDKTEIEKLSKEIETLKKEINANSLEINKLSYKNEIAEIQRKIANKEAEIKTSQNALLYLSDGSKEGNAIRLKITKMQNENTALQQQIDTLSEKPMASKLEKLKNDKTVMEESLDKEYSAFSLKVEEILRIEKQYEQVVKNQKDDNTFADYKVNEELKATNENISKANRNMGYAQEKLNNLYDLAKNPTLYALMDGIVTALNYKLGEATVTDKPFCIIGELSHIRMTVPISATDIGNISIGQKVNIYVDAFAEQKFSGKVTERLLVANDKGDYEVTISVEPNQAMLLPGMKAFATIILKEKKNILTISNKAIILVNGEQYVNIRKENGEIVKTKVTTGFSDGRISEVLDGLSENDVAIVQE